MMNEGVRLSQVLSFVEDIVSKSFQSPFWLNCELSEVKVNSKGHCFVELVEKDATSDKIIAKASGIIWASVFKDLDNKFINATGMSIAPGVKVLLKGRVDFKSLHGLNFLISDIDPTYTLGEVERKRRETLLRLEKEGLLDLNKKIELPWCFQNIAVVSSETAAGYQDFVDQITYNRSKFACKVTLFSALLQGEQAEESILEALDKIQSQNVNFDALVVIRGGGSQLDLSVFDSYRIAKVIAKWNVPVITGIGHTKDVSVLDQLVAVPLKTPTAVADYILDRMAMVYEKINLIGNKFSLRLKQYLEKEHQMHNQNVYLLSKKILSNRITQRNKQERLFKELHASVKSVINKQHAVFDSSNSFLYRHSLKKIHNENRLISSFGQQFSSFCKIDLAKRNNDIKTFYKSLFSMLDNNKNTHIAELGYYEQLVSSYNPSNILKRGYSIVKMDGKLLRDKKDASPGKTLETTFDNFVIYSKVINNTPDE
ncbi:MAG: exodeoxyribonuclease VII large subunit [Prolixibacteraceae bacterium]|jgi:exodeoxyribonuclease VII large subunit|nr:exodeoxyribonuclease VII large subunit [Prolixibacteraceae bacterium]